MNRRALLSTIIFTFLPVISQADPQGRCTAIRVKRYGEEPVPDAEIVLSFASNELQHTVVRLDSCVVNATVHQQCDLSDQRNKSCNGVGCTYAVHNGENHFSVSHDSTPEHPIDVALIVHRGQVLGDYDDFLTPSSPCTVNFCCIRWIGWGEETPKTCRKFHVTTKGGDETTEVIYAESDIFINDASLSVSLVELKTIDDRLLTHSEYKFNNEKRSGTEFPLRTNTRLAYLSLYISDSAHSSQPKPEGSRDIFLPHGYFQIHEGNVVTHEGHQFTDNNRCTRDLYVVELSSGPESLVQGICLVDDDLNMTYAVTTLCCVDYGPPLSDLINQTTTTRNYLDSAFLQQARDDVLQRHNLSRPESEPTEEIIHDERYAYVSSSTTKTGYLSLSLVFVFAPFIYLILP